MLTGINSYNWEEAFKYTAQPTAAMPNDNISLKGFIREDVIEIIALVEGQRDEESWAGVFKLKDGRFACLRAWCDYTGWG